MLECWRLVWRNGIAPGLSTAGLISILQALRTNDQRLLQGATTCPPPMMCVQDWPAEGACIIGWDAWQAGMNPEGRTVGDVRDHFAQVCFDCDDRVGEAAGCRWFINWYEDTQRAEMIREMIPEVERLLAARNRDCILAEHDRDELDAEAGYLASVAAGPVDADPNAPF